MWTRCVAVRVAAEFGQADEISDRPSEHSWPDDARHQHSRFLASFPARLVKGMRRSETRANAILGDWAARSISFDRRQLAAALAEQWEISASCRLVAGYRRRRQMIERNRDIVSIVHVADALLSLTHGFNLAGAHSTRVPAHHAAFQIDPAFVGGAPERPR